MVVVVERHDGLGGGGGGIGWDEIKGIVKFKTNCEGVGGRGGVGGEGGDD